MKAEQTSQTIWLRQSGIPSTPDVPRYPELVRYALDRAGFDAEKFDVYRCRVEYPVMPSTVALTWELPKRPVTRA